MKCVKHLTISFEISLHSLCPTLPTSPFSLALSPRQRVHFSFQFEDNLLWPYITTDFSPQSASQSNLCSLPRLSHCLVLHLTITFEILPPLLKWNCPLNDHIDLQVSSQHPSWTMSSDMWSIDLSGWQDSPLPASANSSPACFNNAFLSWFPFTSFFADTSAMACPYFLSVGMLSLGDLILIHACNCHLCTLTLLNPRTQYRLFS